MGDRFRLFIKVENDPEWHEHLAFYDRGDAERHARDLMLVFPIIEECRILPVKIELRRLSPGRGIFFEAKGNPNSPK